MKLKGIFFFLCLISGLSFAGVDEGQSIRSEFISDLRLVYNYLSRDPSLVPELDRIKLNTIVSLFDSEPTRVLPVTARPLDNRQIEKAAVFNRNSMTIQVHIGTWMDSSRNERGMLAAMELLGIAGMDEDRYEIVATTIFPFEDDFKKLEKVQERLCDAAASQSSTLMGAYFFATLNCWASHQGKEKIRKIESYLREAIQRCQSECQTGHNEKIIARGSCDVEFNINKVRADSKREAGNKCL